jgi:hypothetical protein
MQPQKTIISLNKCYKINHISENSSITNWIIQWEVLDNLIKMVNQDIDHN